MKLTAEQQKLVMEHEWMAFCEARKLHPTGMQEDAYQAGIVGLCKAAQSFDPARDITFKTYCFYYVKGYIQNFYRRTVHSWEVSTPDLDFCYKAVCDRRTFAEDIGLKLDLHEALKQIPIKYRDSIERYFGFNGTEENMPEIANKAGVTRQNIKHNIDKGIKRLRTILRGAYVPA